MRECIMKFRLRESDGKICATPYMNRYIPIQLLDKLNYAVQEALLAINHGADWKKYYIHFEHNGKKYKQVDTETKHVCKGCALLKPMGDGSGRMGCAHPYYATKGNCTGQIYVEE